jgi:hypothetical protein
MVLTVLNGGAWRSICSLPTGRMLSSRSNLVVLTDGKTKTERHCLLVSMPKCSYGTNAFHRVLIIITVVQIFTKASQSRHTYCGADGHTLATIMVLSLLVFRRTAVWLQTAFVIRRSGGAMSGSEAYSSVKLSQGLLVISTA